MKRNAAVAGQFYYGSPDRLTEQVNHYVVKQASRHDAVGIMVPHAGLVYSGHVAGAVYSSINFPKTFIMLGPNHTGLGSPVAVMDDGTWEIPTGTFTVDRKLARLIVRDSRLAKSDSRAHLFEHSLEVQLPFFAQFTRDVAIVPIAVMSATFDECTEIAESIAKAVKAVDYPVVLLASSDMSHYLPDQSARQKDRLAIERILDLDPPGLYQVVTRERISMCGYLPATIMLVASRMLGATKAKLVKYATSGDVSGDYESVVGYAGVVIEK